MPMMIRKSIIGLAAIALCCAGCGGGGGGGGDPVTPPNPQTLGLTAAAPVITGKVGQTVSVPISVAGTGSVSTASFDVTVTEATFEPVVAGTASQEIDGLPATVAASYKWLDTHTIRVLYASADAIASGSVLVSIPVKVKSESPCTPTVGNASINR